MNTLAMIVAATGLSVGALGLAGPDCAGCKAEAEADCPMCVKDVVHSHDEDAKAMKKIDAAEYASADWPAHNKGDALYANDFQGKSLPVALGNETWLSKEIKTEGKVVVLDFWATWCPPCVAASPMLDKMQKENPENLAILAIGGQSEDQDTVTSYMNEHKVAYSHLFDEDQSVFSKFDSEGIPLVVVISTDGVVRWIGNPHDKNFAKAVAQTIKVDPMVNAS